MKSARLIFVVALAGIFSACPVAVAADGSTDITGTIPLVASNVAVSEITSSGATISWDTNGNATAQVFYDTSAHASAIDYAFSTTVDANLVAAHSVGLTGLTAATTYHYRVKSVISDTEFIAISDDNTFTTLASTGGGGGGGGGFGSQLVGIGLSGTSPFMDGNGRAITAGLVSTADGSLSLAVPVGTYVWNAAGAAQSFLSATPQTSPPAPPAQNSLVLAYEMGPTGVTFNPAISLIIRYTDAQIPPGTNESDLYIAWWDSTQWVKLTGVVDAVANTVTVSVSHFTSFSLFAPPAPPPPPAPTLSISTPAPNTSLDSGSSVSLSISVGNLKLVHGANLPKVPGEGCIVYYLDVAIPTTPGQSALSATGTFKESIDTSNAWANLAPGTHTLGVQVVQNDHTPFNPPVYASVSVTIKEPAPPQTSAAPTHSTSPTPNPTDYTWMIVVSAVLATLAAGFLFWKSRRSGDKLQYTNRK